MPPIMWSVTWQWQSHWPELSSGAWLSGTALDVW